MSMIETFRRCQTLTDEQKVKKCFWYFFFDPQKSIKRLHSYKSFERRFGEPNKDFRDFIDEWYKSEDRNVSPLLYYFVRYETEE